VRRLGLTGVDILRYTVLVVRDGEQLSPRIAAVVSAVHAANSELRRQTVQNVQQNGRITGPS
jgi:hypothetical protein